jgi:methionyl-tRNA formyltransferase
MRFILLLANTYRSSVYLDYLCKRKLKPNKVFFFSKKNNKKIIKKLNKEKISYDIFFTDSVNNSKLSKSIFSSKVKYFIYSGNPGEKVNASLTKNKNIIHFHPGRLPMFKGSTVIYYSIILEKSVYCSCIQINNEIDKGKILLTKKFRLPRNLNHIEKSYDALIRAETMVSFLKMKFKKNKKKRIKDKYKPYYIAHPIIRAIVINKKKFKFLRNF